MATLSNAEIIAKNPIGAGLNEFRLLLESRCDELDISGVDDQRSRIAQLVEASDTKDLALELVLALQTAPLARTLPSHNGSGTLLRDLFSLVAHIESSGFNSKSFIALFECIDSHASDQDICAALFAVLTRQKSTPPTIFNKLVLDTPFKSTSSSQRASEQAHDDLDERILQEINGCVYTDTEGFYEKYFEDKEWSDEVERIVKRANPQIVDGIR